MGDLIMTDIGAHVEIFDVFAGKKGRVLAAIRAFMSKRRSRRSTEDACACAQCQTC